MKRKHRLYCFFWCIFFLLIVIIFFLSEGYVGRRAGIIIVKDDSYVNITNCLITIDGCYNVPSCVEEPSLVCCFKCGYKNRDECTRQRGTCSVSTVIWRITLVQLQSVRFVWDHLPNVFAEIINIGQDVTAEYAEKVTNDWIRMYNNTRATWNFGSIDHDKFRLEH